MLSSEFFEIKYLRKSNVLQLSSHQKSYCHQIFKEKEMFYKVDILAHKFVLKWITHI